jgi:hypothetical protein
MQKLITLIVILAVIFAVPPLRERIAAASVPVLERLGPVGSVVLQPVRRLAARNKARLITRTIIIDNNEGRELPTPDTFHRWLTRRLPDETGLDPWGERYWMVRRGTSLIVGSNGPDGVRNTADDVSHTVAFN